MAKSQRIQQINAALFEGGMKAVSKQAQLEAEATRAFLDRFVSSSVRAAVAEERENAAVALAAAERRASHRAGVGRLLWCLTAVSLFWVGMYVGPTSDHLVGAVRDTAHKKATANYLWHEATTLPHEILPYAEQLLLANQVELLSCVARAKDEGRPAECLLKVPAPGPR